MTNRVVSSETFKQAVGSFPSGVTVIAAQCGQQRVGLTVSSFASLSLDPPLVLACVNARSSSLTTLTEAGRVGISILARGQEELARRFASSTDDRFAGVDIHNAEGALLVQGATSWLTGEISDTLAVGDHFIVVIQVDSVMPFPDVDPLLYVRGDLSAASTR